MGGAVKAIHVFEERNCNPNGTDELVGLLQRWYMGSAEVKSFDLVRPEGLVPMAPALFVRLESEGSACLPALVVNGVVVSTGRLPSFDQAVGLIEAGEPLKANQISELPQVNGAGCCGPGGCSC